MKTLSLLTLILLSHLTQNAAAQAVTAQDQKPATIADKEIKRGPLADFYELVAQHPASLDATANTTAHTPTSTTSKIKIPQQDTKPIVAQQSSRANTTKPVSD